MHYTVTCCLHYNEAETKPNYFSHVSAALGVAILVGQSATVVNTEISRQIMTFCSDIHSSPQRRNHYFLYCFSFHPAPLIGSKFLISQRSFSKPAEWNGSNFDTDVHGSQRITPHNFGDAQTFDRVPPADISPFRLK